MVDADTEIILAILDHILKNGHQVARPAVAAAQSSGTVVDAWQPIDLLVAHLAVECVAKRRLNFACQVVPWSGQWVVHALDHREGLAVLEGSHQLDCREWPENVHGDATSGN